MPVLVTVPVMEPVTGRNVALTSNAWVAQSVEQRTRNAQVRSSNLLSGSRSEAHHRGGHDWQVAPRTSCEPDEAVHVTLIAGRSGPDAAWLVVRGGAQLASCALDDQTASVIVGQVRPWDPANAEAVEREQVDDSKRISSPGLPPPSEITRMPMLVSSEDGRRYM